MCNFFKFIINIFFKFVFRFKFIFSFFINIKLISEFWIWIYYECLLITFIRINVTNLHIPKYKYSCCIWISILFHKPWKIKIYKALEFSVHMKFFSGVNSMKCLNITHRNSEREFKVFESRLIFIRINIIIKPTRYFSFVKLSPKALASMLWLWIIHILS